MPKDFFSKTLSLRGRMTPPDGAQNPHALLRARPSGYKTERSHEESSCRPLRHHALHGNNDGSCLLHWTSNYMTIVCMHSIMRYNQLTNVDHSKQSWGKVKCIILVVRCNKLTYQRTAAECNNIS